MNAKEQDILIKKGYEFIDMKITKKTNINSLFIFVSDTRRLHDSGYPYIRIFGEIDNKKLIDLGWHDHYIIECGVNIDAYAKNLFHVMPWNYPNNIFFINQNHIWCSTFWIYKTGELT
jgi:hypothetical protein